MLSSSGTGILVERHLVATACGLTTEHALSLTFLFLQLVAREVCSAPLVVWHGSIVFPPRQEDKQEGNLFSSIAALHEHVDCIQLAKGLRQSLKVPLTYQFLAFASC